MDPSTSISLNVEIPDNNQDPLAIMVTVHNMKANNTSLIRKVRNFQA